MYRHRFGQLVRYVKPNPVTCDDFHRGARCSTIVAQAICFEHPRQTYFHGHHYEVPDLGNVFLDERQR